MIRSQGMTDSDFDFCPDSITFRARVWPSGLLKMISIHHVDVLFDYRPKLTHKEDCAPLPKLKLKIFRSLHIDRDSVCLMFLHHGMCFKRACVVFRKVPSCGFTYPSKTGFRMKPVASCFRENLSSPHLYESFARQVVVSILLLLR